MQPPRTNQELSKEKHVENLGSRLKGKVLERVSQCFASATELSEHCLVPETMFTVLSLSIPGPPEDQPLAASNGMKKLELLGEAMDHAAFDQEAFKSLRKKACLLWEPMLKREGFGEHNLFDKRWMMFPTSKLQELVADMMKRRVMDAKRKARAIVASIDPVPQVTDGGNSV